MNPVVQMLRGRVLCGAFLWLGVVCPVFAIDVPARNRPRNNTDPALLANLDQASL
jgi:hypothetical protein